MELFGKKADATVVKELTQIHKLETYEPILYSDLSGTKKGRPWNTYSLSQKREMGI